MKESATCVTQEIKCVWQHHFGLRLIMRKGDVEDTEDETVKMIRKDQDINEKIIVLYKKWRNLEMASRRADRSASISFKMKLKLLKKELEMPFSICKQSAEDIIKGSGIIDWQEETEYLRSQLSLEQTGCPGGWDSRQMKRDNRKMKTQFSADASAELSKALMYEINQRKADFEEELEMDDEEHNNDQDIIGPRAKRGKIDMMGGISLTADARNISVRNKIFLAASVSNTLGVNLAQTNISQTTAWRKGRNEHFRKSDTILKDFKYPNKVVVHWDSKTLSHWAGSSQSGFVCIFQVLKQTRCPSCWGYLSAARTRV